MVVMNFFGHDNRFCIFKLKDHLTKLIVSSVIIIKPIHKPLSCSLLVCKLLPQRCKLFLNKFSDTLISAVLHIACKISKVKLVSYWDLLLGHDAVYPVNELLSRGFIASLASFTTEIKDAVC